MRGKVVGLLGGLMSSLLCHLLYLLRGWYTSVLTHEGASRTLRIQPRAPTLILGALVITLLLLGLLLLGLLGLLLLGLLR